MKRLKIFIHTAAALLLSVACRAQILNEDRIREDAHLYYSNANLLKEDAEDIISRLKAATSPSDRNDLAVAYARVGRPDLSESILESIAANNTIDRTGLLNLARLRFLEGEPERARSAYLMLITKGLLSSAGFDTFVRTLLSDGRGAEAALFQRSRLEVDRNSIQTALWLGSYYTGNHEYGNALSQFERVLEIDPKNATALFSVGHIYFNGQDYARASEYFGHAKRYGSTEPGLIYLLAFSLYRGDRAEEALNLLEKRSEVDPRTTLLHLELLSLLKFAADPGALLNRLSPEERRAVMTELFAETTNGDGSGDAGGDGARLLATMRAIRSEFLDLY